MPLDAPVTPRTADVPILRNPFHLLGVSARDNRQRIVEAAEERSLTLDGEICAKTRSDLTHPRNRLAAELAWLPGIPPRWSGQFLDVLVQDPAGVFRADGLPALIRANLMASAILGLDAGLDETAWVSCILALSRAVEDVSAASVLAAINEDRAVAGFTEVKGVAAVEEGLAERRREFRACLRSALDKLPSRKLARVAAAAAEAATNGGTAHPPALIDGVVDAYAVGTHAFLTKEADNVKLLIDRIRGSAFSGGAAIEPFLARLETAVRNWHSVARPIQLLARAKGTAHRPSRDVADAVRGLGLYLGKTCVMLDPARRIIVLLKEAFGHLPEIAERIDEDARALDDVARRKAQGAAPPRAAAPAVAPAPAMTAVPPQAAANAARNGTAMRWLVAVPLALVWFGCVTLIVMGLVLRVRNATGPTQPPSVVSSSPRYTPVVPFRAPIRGR